MLPCCVLIDSDVPCPMIMDFKIYNSFTETDKFRQADRYRQILGFSFPKIPFGRCPDGLTLGQLSTEC